MISPTDARAELSPGSRRVAAVDPIESEEGLIDLRAVYRHFRPTHDRLDLHTFSFRYTVTDTGTYLLGLDEWIPPERSVSAWQVGMLRYVDAYVAHDDMTASLSVPVPEHGDYIEDPPADSYAADAELRMR